MVWGLHLARGAVIAIKRDGRSMKMLEIQLQMKNGQPIKIEAMGKMPAKVSAIATIKAVTPMRVYLALLPLNWLTSMQLIL